MRWQEIAEQQLKTIRRWWSNIAINNRVWHILTINDEYEIKIFPYNLGMVGYYGRPENLQGRWKLMIYSILRNECLFDNELYCDTVEPVLIKAATTIALDIELEMEKALLK